MAGVPARHPEFIGAATEDPVNGTMVRPTEGEIHSFERTFTVEDVRQFAELSGDTQPRHTDPDGEGRLMVHGLLTATLPTKIGGELEVLAHTMEFDFVAPVYTGQRVTCRWTNDRVETREDRYEVSVTIVCETGDGVVLRGRIEGVVWQDSRRSP